MEEIINQLKYGFGSPGETSNAILTSYLQAKSNSPLATSDELFTKVYLYRKMAEEISSSQGIKDGNYSLLTIQNLLDISDGCIAMFAFFLMTVDSKIFFENVAVDIELFKIITRIIHDNACNKAPFAVKDAYDTFNSMCGIMYEQIKNDNSRNMWFRKK